MGKENLHVLMEVFVVNYYASQQIYDALGDSDGVAGVAAIRVSEPSLHEQILQYESTGNTDNILLLCVGKLFLTPGAFHDAADCYTKAIQQDRTALDFHEVQHACIVLTDVRGLCAVLLHAGTPSLFDEVWRFHHCSNECPWSVSREVQSTERE